MNVVQLIKVVHVVQMVYWLMLFKGSVSQGGPHDKVGLQGLVFKLYLTLPRILYVAH